MPDYQQDGGGGVIRTRDGAAIPPDPSNRDWQDYLAWAAEGNTPDPPLPEPPHDDSARLEAAAKVAEAAGLTADQTAALFGIDPTA